MFILAEDFMFNFYLDLIELTCQICRLKPIAIKFIANRFRQNDVHDFHFVFSNLSCRGNVKENISHIKCSTILQLALTS